MSPFWCMWNVSRTLPLLILVREAWWNAREGRGVVTMCWIGIPSGGSSNTPSYFMLRKPEKALPKQASRLKHKLLCSLIINIFIKKIDHPHHCQTTATDIWVLESFQVPGGTVMSFSVIVHLAHLHILQSTDFVNRIQIRGDIFFTSNKTWSCSLIVQARVVLRRVLVCRIDWQQQENKS